MGFIVVVVIVTVSIARIKYPVKNNFTNEGFFSGLQFLGEEGQIKSIMKGRHLYRSMRLTGHSLVTVRKQRAISRKWIQSLNLHSQGPIPSTKAPSPNGWTRSTTSQGPSV